MRLLVFLNHAIPVARSSVRRSSAERRDGDVLSGALSMALLVLRVLIVLWVPVAIAVDVDPIRADCLSPPGGAPTFTATEVARIPVGTDPESISATECEDCGDFCEVGFAFLGPDGALYVYDLANANIKVLREGSSGVWNLELLPGVRDIVGGEGRVYDGAVDREGTIYLLNDRATETGKYRLFYRARGDTVWKVADPLGAVAGPERWGHESDGVEGARLRILPDDALAVYFGDQRSSPSTVVAREGRPLPAVQRVILGVGAPLAGGRRATVGRGATTVVSGPSPVVIRSGGEYLGSDDFGNLFYLEGCPGPPWVLTRYDTHGRISATGSLPPETRFWKGLTTKFMFVSPDGDVFECWPTREALRVLRWHAEGVR